MKLLFSLLFFIILAMGLSPNALAGCGGAEGGCDCTKNTPAEYKVQAPTTCPGSCMCQMKQEASLAKS